MSDTATAPADRVLRVPLDIELSDHWYSSAQVHLFANSDESYESARALLARQGIHHTERIVHLGGDAYGLSTRWDEANVWITLHGPRGHLPRLVDDQAPVAA